MYLINILADTTFNWTWIMMAGAIGLLLALLIMNRNKWDKEKLAMLDVKDFVEMMRKGSLIDTRKEEEIAATGKIIGSRNFPGKTGASEAKVRKDLPIFLYDQNGSTSKMKSIGAKYIKNGAVMVYILKGGYQSFLEYKEKNS